jgi:hypothetical protein
MLASNSWQELNIAAYGINTLVTYSIGTGLIGKYIGSKSNREVSQRHRVRACKLQML